MDSELWKHRGSLSQKSRKKSSRELFASIGPVLERARMSLYAVRVRACRVGVCGYTRLLRLCVISVEAYWSSGELRRFAHAHKSSRKQDKYHRASPWKSTRPSTRAPTLRRPETCVWRDSSLVSLSLFLSSLERIDFGCRRNVNVNDYGGFDAIK